MIKEFNAFTTRVAPSWGGRSQLQVAEEVDYLDHQSLKVTDDTHSDAPPSPTKDIENMCTDTVELPNHGEANWLPQPYPCKKLKVEITQID